MAPPQIAAVGRNLRRIRSERGISQTALAAQTRLHRQTILALEAGRHKDLAVSTLQALAKALDVGLADLTAEATD
jgi:transcriptional regulator with XRE-family HTH domain